MIDDLKVIDHDLLLHASDLSSSLVMFRDKVVRPSLRKIDDEIVACESRDDVVSDFEREDLADLYDHCLKGYLLTTQATVERGMRKLLANAVKRTPKDADNRSSLLKKVQKCPWHDDMQESIQRYFKSLLGLTLDQFDSYDELQILFCVGNVMRHGDGSSMRKLHELAPSLPCHWNHPGLTLPTGHFIPASGPDAPSFEQTTFTTQFLEQMIQSAIWFCEDVDCIRCNSFANKHNTTVDRLSQHRQDHAKREACRVWWSHPRV
jgi:hypothetical protein